MSEQTWSHECDRQGFVTLPVGDVCPFCSAKENNGEGLIQSVNDVPEFTAVQKLAEVQKLIKIAKRLSSKRVKANSLKPATAQRQNLILNAIERDYRELAKDQQGLF